VKSINKFVKQVKIHSDEAGQTTAEYALVILGSAAIATLLLTWASKSGGITKLFDMVVGRLIPG
jgi:Flp pilus assembly pilin Flp